MKRKVNILTYLYLVFMILLFLSGSISGVLGLVIYCLSFVIPIAIGIYLSRNTLTNVSLSLGREQLGFSLPLVMPTLSVIIIISFLTSLFIFVTTGKTNSVDLGDSLVLAVLSHALIPAVLEELLFRYIPIRLLSEHSERVTILVSAFFFALVHHDFFSIPYAFLAGVIFMTVDLATGSLIPSILIHFINNLSSVIVVMYGETSIVVTTLYLLIAILTAISLIFIIKKRGEYTDVAKRMLYKFELTPFTVEMLIFAAINLTIAFVSLF